MNFPIQSLVAVCTMGTSLAFPQAANETAASKLKEIVDPTAASINRGTADDDLAEEIRHMIITGDSSAIGHLGDSALPHLESLSRTCTLPRLVDGSDFRTPFHWLARISPSRGCQLLLDLAKHDAERFRAIIRRRLAPFTEESPFPEDAQFKTNAVASSVLAGYLEAVVSDPILSLDWKLSIAANAYEKGHTLPATSALIESTLESASYRHLGPNGLGHFILKGAVAPQADLAEALALQLIERCGTEPVVVALAASPHPVVRIMALHAASASSFGPESTRLALLACQNESNEEVFPTMDRVLVSQLKNEEFPVTLEEFVAFAELLSRRPSSFAAEGLGTALRVLIGRATPEDAPGVQKAVRTIYSADFGQVHEDLVSLGLRTAPCSAEIAQAVVEGMAGTRFMPERLLIRVGDHWLEQDDAVASPATAQLLLSMCKAFDPADHAHTLNIFAPWFAGLPKTDIPEALTWLGRSDSRYDAAASMSPRLWGGAIDALRAAAHDATRPWRERSLAMVGLLYGCDLADDDVKHVAASLAQEWDDPKKRAEFLNLYFGGAGDRNRTASPYWNQVVGYLFADSSVNDDALAEIHIEESTSRHGHVETLQSVLDGASKRVANNAGRVSFRKLAEPASMAIHPHGAATSRHVNVPSSLLDAWIATERPSIGHHESVVRLVQARLANAHDGDLVSRTRSALLRGIQQTPRHSTTIKLADLVLGLGDHQSLEALVFCASLLGDSNRQAIIYAQVETYQRLADQQLRLCRGEEATTPTREEAVLEVLKLLDNKDEAIRIEAIRGLATLGAVETLPRLIPLISRGSDAEKAAVRKTLDDLSALAKVK